MILLVTIVNQSLAFKLTQLNLRNLVTDNAQVSGNAKKYVFVTVRYYYCILLSTEINK